MAPLLSLPSEVLVEIFSYLRPRDIAACQRSCRQLNDTVNHSQLLRYLIRVGRAGLHDPLFPGYTIGQRIEALEKWEAAWSDLEVIESDRPYVEYKVPFKMGPSRIHDDFLIIMTFARTSSGRITGYGYLDLRTFQQEMEKDPWTKITNDSWGNTNEIREFVFCVEQDLALVILTPTTYDTPSMFFELHAISFSRGTPHPYVVSATIPIERLLFCSVTSVIVSDRTILNVTSGHSQRIFLHSWKDGHVYLLREAGGVPWSQDIVILSRDTMALVESDSITLELCRIVEESDGGAPSLCTLVRLGFPPLSRHIYLSGLQCIQESVSAYADAPSLVIEGRPPRRVPFRSSTEEGLVAVTIQAKDSHDSVECPARKFTIVIHLRALVALTTTPSPGVTFIPWENWGPRVTACFDGYAHRYAVMGERLAIATDDILFLLDFNSSRIRDTIRRSGNSSGYSGFMTTVKHVKHKSVVPRRALSRKDVIGELPYISIHPRGFFNCLNFVNYEEVLAGILCRVRGRLFPSSVASKH